MLKMKNTATEMKTAFGEFICRLDMRVIKQNRTSKDCGTKDVTYTQQEHQTEKKKEEEEILEEMMTENFPQINVRQQTTHLRTSENTKQGKCLKNYIYACQSQSNHKEYLNSVIRRQTSRQWEIIQQ